MHKWSHCLVPVPFVNNVSQCVRAVTHILDHKKEDKKLGPFR
jgi:hypothetical protein